MQVSALNGVTSYYTNFISWARWSQALFQWIWYSQKANSWDGSKDPLLLIPTPWCRALLHGARVMWEQQNTHRDGLSLLTLGNRQYMTSVWVSGLFLFLRTLALGDTSWQVVSSPARRWTWQQNKAPKKGHAGGSPDPLAPLLSNDKDLGQNHPAKPPRIPDPQKLWHKKGLPDHYFRQSGLRFRPTFTASIHGHSV